MAEKHAAEDVRPDHWPPVTCRARRSSAAHRALAAPDPDSKNGLLALGEPERE
jgi:hypothetical protein